MDGGVKTRMHARNTKSHVRIQWQKHQTTSCSRPAFFNSYHHITIYTNKRTYCIYFFLGSQVAWNFTLKVNKWSVWGSNSDSCTYSLMSQPIELSSWGHILHIFCCCLIYYIHNFDFFYNKINLIYYYTLK
jgi:hypothetical protein